MKLGHCYLRAFLLMHMFTTTVPLKADAFGDTVVAIIYMSRLVSSDQTYKLVHPALILPVLKLNKTLELLAVKENTKYGISMVEADGFCTYSLTTTRLVYGGVSVVSSRELDGVTSQRYLADLRALHQLQISKNEQKDQGLDDSISTLLLSQPPDTNTTTTYLKLLFDMHMDYYIAMAEQAANFCENDWILKKKYSDIDQAIAGIPGMVGLGTMIEGAGVTMCVVTPISMALGCWANVRAFGGAMLTGGLLGTFCVASRGQLVSPIDVVKRTTKAFVLPYMLAVKQANHLAQYTYKTYTHRARIVGTHM